MAERRSVRENELCDGVLLDLRTGEGRELGKRPAFSLLAASFTSSVVATSISCPRWPLGEAVLVFDLALGVGRRAILPIKAK